MRLLIFTDVDGTLIDFATYEPGPATGALERCRRLGVPVIPVTSKSAVEIVRLRSRLGLEAPFAVENGAAIWVPVTDPVASAAGSLAGERDIPADTRDGYLRVVSGTPRAELVAGLDDVLSGLGVENRSLSAMTTEEVAERTGLGSAAAAAAADREFSEPFLLLREGRMLTPDERIALFPELEMRARERGLTCLLGGRFFHLLGVHNKGTAVRFLIEAYRRSLAAGEPPPLTMALGDAPNDGDMLAVVDHPVLIARPDGTHASLFRLAGLERVDGIGPAGWAVAVSARLDALGD